MQTHDTLGAVRAAPAFDSHLAHESQNGSEAKYGKENKNSKESPFNEAPLNQTQLYEPHPSRDWMEQRPLPVNWRDRVLNEALHAGRYYDENLDALLVAIRRCQPDHATVTLWPERRQLLRFLEQETQHLQSLLQANAALLDEDDLWSYLGWFGLEWEGAAIEVALGPNGGIYRYVICSSRNEEVLQRFAHSMDRYTERPAGRCLRYTQGWSSAPDLDEELGKVTWDDIVLQPETLAGVRATVEGFFSERDAFRKLGFAWRRGMLLVGPPGTGKTMICKAVAAALPDLPFLYVRDLREERKKEALKHIFSRARRLAPCILAFEDLDGLVGDESRTIFLNEVDGFGDNEGIFIIASSNHPEKIDQALLKRPSRFDRVFIIGLPAKAERQAYCLQVLERSALSEHISPTLDRLALSAAVAKNSHGFTPAYLKEAITSAALQRAQAGVMVLDDEFAAAVLAQVEELRSHLRRTRNADALGDVGGDECPIGFRQNRLIA